MTVVFEQFGNHFLPEQGLSGLAEQKNDWHGDEERQAFIGDCGGIDRQRGGGPEAEERIQAAAEADEPGPGSVYSCDEELPSGEFEEVRPSG